MERSAETEFEAFVAGCGPSLLRTAWLLTGDRGHAEDIVQTALERTARHWTRLSATPQAYARRAVVNLATDRWRRRRARVAEVALDRASERPAAPDPIGTVDLRRELVAGLAKLPPRQRAVLVLRYFHDLDEQATAAELGITVGTVKSAASRGLARLRAGCGDRDRLPAAGR